MSRLISVFFIVNANQKIGVGHLKRCMLLADEFNKYSIPSIFMSFELSKTAHSLLKEKKYPTVIYEGISEFKENSIHQLPNGDSLIIVDTDEACLYTLDFQQSILNTANKLMYISIKNDVKYCAHYFLNQNVMALSESYDTSAFTINFLGPSYFILDDTFKAIVPNQFVERKKENLLISFGSSDPQKNTIKIISLLHSFQHYFNKIRIVVGGLNSELETIQNHPFVIENKELVEVYYNTKDMYGLMRNTDVAFTSMGLAFWELTLHKIPCLVLSGSKREKSQIDYFCEHNYSHFIGNFDDELWEEQWKKNIFQYFNSHVELNIDELYQKINVNGKTKVVERIIETY